MNLLKITDAEFIKFQKLIEGKIGIKFPDAKRSLIESRIAGHISKLGLNSFNDYYSYILNDESNDEIEYFIDKITTHTTQFFREENHFDYLKKEGIGIINKYFRNKTLKILSLGASTGEEMYTIAMILLDMKKTSVIHNYEIHGADISKHSLLKAKSGIFKKDHFQSIPEKYKNYFIIKENSIEAKNILKADLRYFLLNASCKDQIFPDKYHIIFCRNMLIYFNKELQQIIIDNISNNIFENGLIFIGHSESLFGLINSFKKLSPTIYQKDAI